MCSNSRIEWLGVFIMDFTDAYTHILSLVSGRQVSLLDSHKYHGGLIETYITNNPEQDKDFVNIYLIVTDSSNTTESLKSVVISEENGKYRMNGYWPSQSFYNVYSTLQTNNSLVPFLQSWIKHMENISFQTLLQIDRTKVINKVSQVSNNNKRQARKGTDLNIYPMSLHRRAVDRITNKRQRIGKSQKNKIIEQFGYEALHNLEQSIFTIHFTQDPLKQKTINLMDLPEQS